jgi:hypothetical protein
MTGTRRMGTRDCVPFESQYQGERWLVKGKLLTSWRFTGGRDISIFGKDMIAMMCSKEDVLV